MTLASRIVVLAGGGISQVGAPLELYEKPRNEFVAQFIGSPAMNLLPGEIVETGNQTKVHIDGGKGAVLSNYPSRDADKGRKVRIGIRPEDFHPVEGDDWAFSGTVDIAESLGEVTLLYFQKDAIGEQEQVIAKLNGIHPDMRGRTVHMSADPGKVHLFADGQSLLYR
jgi:alpha-glucoside transport system ATP-binding protein